LMWTCPKYRKIFATRIEYCYICIPCFHLNTRTQITYPNNLLENHLRQRLLELHQLPTTSCQQPINFQEDYSSLPFSLHDQPLRVQAKQQHLM
jgi:hypothetical protein